jgi:hypothetical protein
MLARVAACATLFLFSPVCSGIDGSSALRGRSPLHPLRSSRLQMCSGKNSLRQLKTK